MGDSYIFQQALSDDVTSMPMTDKEMLYVQDTNGSSYNGQVTFETSSLSNSGRWLNWREGYMAIPFVIAMRSGVDITGDANGFMAGLKNGTHQLIDSISVDYNNTNVVQLTPYTNFAVNYRIMTEWSTDDLEKHGAATLVNPDTVESFIRTPASLDGLGTINNRLTDATPTVAPTWATTLSKRVNEGALERFKSTAFPAAGVSGYEVNSSGLANVQANHFTNDGGAAAARVYQWNILAIIRLKDLSDFFDKIPMVKGGFLRIQVNYNAADVTTNHGAAGIISSYTVTQTAGRSVPFMVSSGVSLNPSNTSFVAADGSNIEFSAGVVSATFGSTHPLGSCRLYVPGYTLEPMKERELLEVNPVADVEYEDLYNYTVTGKSSNGSLNEIITNGIANIQKVIVIPQDSSTDGGASKPWQSPFDTSPSTSLPAGSILNFNVQVGGTNLFQRQKNYDFEEFLDEVGRSGIDDGLQTGLSSGLLSYKDWSLGYRYYVADVSRRKLSEQDVPKSILVTGINNSTVTADYVVFVCYMRKISIDLTNGALQRI